VDPATNVCGTTDVVIAGQGTYSLDPTTGIVTYTADANAIEGAKTPVTYKITDELGRTATNTLTPTIYPKPTADDDTSSGAYDTNQTIFPFSNDDNVPGQDLGSLALCGINPVQTPNSCDKDSVITADGVYTVDGNTVVFNPDPDFGGVRKRIQSFISALKA
jgi:CshA-type fibril repeat protein